MRNWLRWIFRRGARSSLLLNMSPGDEVVSMIQYKSWLAIMTRGGELYLVSTDEFNHPEVDPALSAMVHRVKP